MKSAEKLTIWTIGHSAAEPAELVRLLRAQGIQVLVDVRSVPYSRFAPQANRETLESVVKSHGVQYLFRGDELGGRPRDASEEATASKPDYARIERTAEYQRGIAALGRLGADERACVLCSEEDPAHCHRGLLIAETLVRAGWAILHIRHDGQVEPHAAMLLRRDKGQLPLF
jgi:uncharacterized protein (DUF488 family)